MKPQAPSENDTKCYSYEGCILQTKKCFAIIKTLTSGGDNLVTKLHRIDLTLFQQTKPLQNGLPNLSIYYVNI